MKTILSVLVLIFALSANAQTNSQAESSPGYIAFQDLQNIYGEPKVEINLGGTILGFVGAISKHEDPELAEIIKKLLLVRVLVYSLVDDPEQALNTVDNITTEMKSKNWIPVVSVNEGEEKVRIFMHLTKDVVDGMVVMAVGQKSIHNRNEAVFINVVGELDPAQLSRVMKSLDVDVEV